MTIPKETDRQISDYIQQVVGNIRGSHKSKQRIAEDLRTQIYSNLEEGKALEVVFEGLGEPKLLAAELGRNVKIELAPIKNRVSAFIADFLLVGIILFGVSLVLFIPSPQLVMLYVLIFSLSFIGVILLYFPLAEVLFGKTVGKWLMGISVIDIDSHQRISYAQGFLRRIPLYLSGVFVLALFDVGYLFFNEGRRAFDKVANTVVVTDDRPRYVLTLTLIGGLVVAISLGLVSFMQFSGGVHHFIQVPPEHVSARVASNIDLEELGYRLVVTNEIAIPNGQSYQTRYHHHRSNDELTVTVIKFDSSANTREYWLEWDRNFRVRMLSTKRNWVNRGSTTFYSTAGYYTAWYQGNWFIRVHQQPPVYFNNEGAKARQLIADYFNTLWS